MNQVIDLSTLTWVKKELDETLREARQSLEAHVENPQDEAQLGFLSALLHQVYGTLQMVELYGASLLAEEMESVAKAIAGSAVTQHADACEVLMRAILQLPDYLDRLIAGSRDVPLVLLPLLNDLRAVRGENLLSENSMFSPDLHAKLPERVSRKVREGNIQERAKELRNRFQRGLLGWFRGVNTDQALLTMSDVLAELQDMSGHDTVSRVWWVAKGLIEALKERALEVNVSINRVLGHVDREIKRLADEGELRLEQTPSLDLLKNLMFYVARARSGGAEIAEIQETYRLRDLIPDEQELALARESISGQNSDLFATVAVAVKEELARLKDVLDLVLRGGGKKLEDLDPLIDSLRSLGDTLGMLSLDTPRKAMLAKSTELSTYKEAGDTPPETLLMEIAGTLLFVESSVEAMGGGRAVGGSDVPDQQLAQSEYGQVMEVVFQEAINDLVRGKEAIIDYIAAGHDAHALHPVPQLFNQVKGGLLLLGEPRAAALVSSAARYIDNDLCKREEAPPQQELDSLAEAICGLEYYLEGRREHRMYGGAAMVLAEQSIEKLGYPAGQANSEDPLQVQAPADGRASAKVEHEEVDSEGVDPQLAGEVEIAGPVEIYTSESPDPRGGAGETLADTLGTHEGGTDEHATGSSFAGDAHADEYSLEVGDEAISAQEIPQAAELDRFESNEVQEMDFPLSSERDARASAAADGDSQELTAEMAVTPIEDGFAVIGDEVDDEILEIFIEEAEEEVRSISDQLPRWARDVDNDAALGTLRRSYHTLKGSGRLVGAMRIGEFAWAFENMLNKVIEGAVGVTPQLLQLLEEACRVLPELVRQVKDGTPVHQPVANLMRCAEALSKGQSLPETSESVPRDPSRPDRSVVPAQAPKMLAMDAAEAGHPESEKLAIQGDEDADEISRDGIMDAMLYEIFNTESQGHLEVIRQFLNQVASGDATVTEELARALHTLHGSAHMARAGAIAELSGELERYAKALINVDAPMHAKGCDALQDSAQMIEQMLASLPFELTEPERFESVIAVIRALRNSVPTAAAEPADDDFRDEQSSPERFEELTATASTEWIGEDEDPYTNCDQELLDIFLEESEENLEVSEAALQRWREATDDAAAIAELQRAVHTLKGGARMAGLPQIGDLAHSLESLVSAITEHPVQAVDEALNGVQKAHDGLVGMLDQVRTRQPIEAQDSLIRELTELSTRRSVTQPDPTSSVAAVSSEVEIAPPATADAYSEVDPELLEVFLEEASDILEHSEETLRSWKDDPKSTSLMAELQRELHTLKGGARMADITEVGDLAHAVESLMVQVTAGQTAATPVLFAALQQAQDCLNDMIQLVRKRAPVTQAQSVLARLETLRNGGELSEAEPVPAQSVSEATERALVEKISTGSEAEHAERREKSRDNQELVRVKAKLLDNMVNYAGEVSIYRSRLEQQIGAFRFNLVEMEQTVSRLREQLRKLEIETEAQILFRYETETANLDEQFDPLEMDRYSHMQQLSRSLVESVSDLGSIQALLENITGESETLLLQQSRVNTELQEGLMRTRMVPFLGLAARMRRIVRQTCQTLGKKAELELSGAEGEMDRTVVDRIIAPLEHMLRNAISHGIETPEQRRAKGKPETGTIRITLDRESSDVVLTIADDGAGISLHAIRKKAIERGLMKPDSDFTDTEILQFILETGFSTAEKVTQVAGRGVGMDVVNSEVKQLGGSLHIDSREGKGTTFTIRLPFTLALNQALLIEVGEDTYAIPLSSIEGIVRMPRTDIKKHYEDPETRFSYGGREYEVRHLGTLLGTGQPHIDSGPKRMPVLLTRVGEHCVAFQVENLIGSREIVVKSVGPQISTVRGVSGATILGDGRVVMILDLPAMLRGGMSDPLAQVEEIFRRSARTRGLTVMVVDDSITVRKVTTRLLERNDMNVIAAKDGVDAVAKLQENIPDIMLLDIEMPRMDGFELATHVRNEPRLRDIPIIMITSRTGDKHRQRAMQIGVNRYLGKPFQESELLDNIKSLLAD